MAKQALKRLTSDVFGSKLLSTPKESNKLNNSAVYLGLEAEIEYWDGSVPAGWTAHNDDSLRNNGKEFVTDPVCGDTVLDRIGSFYERYVKGGWVSSVRTGIHVHINMSDRDPEFLLKFIACFMIFERTLFRYAGLWRKYCNFCYPVYEAPEQVTALLKALDKYDGQKKLKLDLLENKYTALNLNPLSSYGTVEVRILPTVSTAEEMTDWVNAILAIYNVADKYPSIDELRADAKNTGWVAWAERELGLAGESFRPFLKDLDIRRGIREANYIESYKRDISTAEPIPKRLLERVPNAEVKVSDTVFSDFQKFEKFLQTCTLNELLEEAYQSLGAGDWADDTVFAVTFPATYAKLKELAVLTGAI